MAALDDPNVLKPLTGGESPLVTAPATGGLPGVSAAAPVSGPAGYTPITPIKNFDPNSVPAGLGGVNYQSIISSNPDYMAWRLGAGERADTAQANRRAAMKALAVRFGGLPAGFNDPYGDIDPDTARIANENQVSESQRLLRAYQQQVESNRRQLAARGMLQSGELGYGQGQLDIQRASDVYDLNNQFLDAAQGTINDYAGVIAGLNAEQIDQLRAAAQASYESGLYGGGYGDFGGGGGGFGGYGGGEEAAAGGGGNFDPYAGWNEAVIQQLFGSQDAYAPTVRPGRL